MSNHPNRQCDIFLIVLSYILHGSANMTSHIITRNITIIRKVLTGPGLLVTFIGYDKDVIVICSENCEIYFDI